MATEKGGRGNNTFDVAYSAVYNTYVQPLCSGSSAIIRVVGPHDVDLANENDQTDEHGDRNDGQIDARKLQSTNTDVLSAQNIAPEHAR